MMSLSKNYLSSRVYSLPKTRAHGIIERKIHITSQEFFERVREANEPFRYPRPIVREIDNKVEIACFGIPVRTRGRTEQVELGNAVLTAKGKDFWFFGFDDGVHGSLRYRPEYLIRRFCDHLYDSSGKVVTRLREDARELCAQERDLANGGAPDGFLIDLAILMNDEIAHPHGRMRVWDAVHCPRFSLARLAQRFACLDEQVL